MDNLIERILIIFTTTSSLSGITIGVVSFLKSLRSERRTRQKVNKLAEDLLITREGIVQGFKEAVVTKDVRVSLNKQVQHVLDDGLDRVLAIVSKAEEKRTKLTYWAVRILRYTAATNKLTTEDQAELDELLAMIADDEQIVDTGITYEQTKD